MINSVHRIECNIDRIYDDVNKRTLSQIPVSQNIQSIDTVNVHTQNIITDEEAEEAIKMVQNSVKNNTADALTLHGGLDYNKVMALLGDIE